MDWVLTIIALAVLAAAPGLILGPRVSIVASAAVAVVFVLAMTIAGVWAASCWNCRLDPDATMVRHQTLLLAPLLVGVFVVPMIAGLCLVFLRGTSCFAE